MHCGISFLFFNPGGFLCSVRDKTQKISNRVYIFSGCNASQYACAPHYSEVTRELINIDMMTSSNGNIFRVTGHLYGEFTGPGEFPSQRPVTQSFDVFFDLRLNKWLSKQPWGWWFETLSWSLWHHCNELPTAWQLVQHKTSKLCFSSPCISAGVALQGVA